MCPETYSKVDYKSEPCRALVVLKALYAFRNSGCGTDKMPDSEYDNSMPPVSHTPSRLPRN